MSSQFWSTQLWLGLRSTQLWLGLSLTQLWLGLRPTQIASLFYVLQFQGPPFVLLSLGLQWRQITTLTVMNLHTIWSSSRCMALIMTNIQWDKRHIFFPVGLTCQAVRQGVHKRCPHGSILTSLSFSAQILHNWNVDPISQYSSYCSWVTLMWSSAISFTKNPKSGLTFRPSGNR